MVFVAEKPFTFPLKSSFLLNSSFKGYIEIIKFWPNSFWVLPGPQVVSWFQYTHPTVYPLVIKHGLLDNPFHHRLYFHIGSSIYGHGFQQARWMRAPDGILENRQWTVWGSFQIHVSWRISIFDIYIYIYPHWNLMVNPKLMVVESRWNPNHSANYHLIISPLSHHHVTIMPPWNQHSSFLIPIISAFTSSTRISNMACWKIHHLSWIFLRKPP